MSQCYFRTRLVSFSKKKFFGSGNFFCYLRLFNLTPIYKGKWIENSVYSRDVNANKCVFVLYLHSGGHTRRRCNVSEGLENGR